MSTPFTFAGTIPIVKRIVGTAVDERGRWHLRIPYGHHSSRDQTGQSNGSEGAFTTSRMLPIQRWLALSKEQSRALLSESTPLHVNHHLFVARDPPALFCCLQDDDIEDTAQKIAECLISEGILKNIGDLQPWAELRVFEEEGDDAYNIVTCVSNTKLVELKRRIAGLFISSVRNVDATLDTITGLDIFNHINQNDLQYPLFAAAKT